MNMTVSVVNIIFNSEYYGFCIYITRQYFLGGEVKESVLVRWYSDGEYDGIEIVLFASHNSSPVATYKSGIERRFVLKHPYQ